MILDPDLVNIAKRHVKWFTSKFIVSTQILSFLFMLMFKLLCTTSKLQLKSGLDRPPPDLIPLCIWHINRSLSINLKYLIWGTCFVYDIKKFLSKEGQLPLGIKSGGGGGVPSCHVRLMCQMTYPVKKQASKVVLNKIT